MRTEFIPSATHYRVATLSAAVITALSLTACEPSSLSDIDQGSASAADAPSTTAESASEQPASDTASPEATATEFDPAITLRQEEIIYEDDEVPVYLDAQVPEVTGVDERIATVFRQRFDDVVNKKLEEAHEGFKTELDFGMLDLQCSEHFDTNDDVCGSEAQMLDVVTGVWEDYVSMSFVVQFYRGGNGVSQEPESITFNARTGEPAVDASEFIDTSDPNIARWIAQHGQCVSNMGDGSAWDGQVQAFTPTHESLYLAWFTGSFDAMACGPASATVPWWVINGEDGP